MGRLRGFLWLFAGLAMAAMAGIVAFVTISRAAPAAADAAVAKPMVAVVVAVRMVPARTVLVAEDLVANQVPVDAAAEGAIPDPAQAIGQMTLTDLYPGEVVLAQRLVDPNEISGDGRVAVALAEDEVLVALPATDLLSQTDVLKPGDHIDIYASLEFAVDQLASGSGSGTGASTTNQDDKLATFCLLENVEVAALLGGSSEQNDSGASNPLGSSSSPTQGLPQVILVTVSPQSALILKYVRDAGGVQDLALRAPGVEQPFSAEPVDAEYLIRRYSIPIESTFQP
jgi:pilus assembly protein CpaB